MPFEASNTAVVITAKIDIAVTKTPSHIFRLDTLFTGMCSTSFSISYISNNEIITRALKKITNTLFVVVTISHQTARKNGINAILRISHPHIF